ncbi:MAG: class I SAM-dependent methyltransferase [Bacteroidota bacterium]
MLKQFIKPIYHFSHDLLFQTRQLNPLFKQKHGGYPILQGHISDEHLADPALEELLAKGLQEVGVSVAPYEIDIEGYYQYLERAQYPLTYYGGGLDPQQNFTEKTLEHYVSLDFLNLQTDSVFIDVAACTSPFFQIIRRLYDVKATYNQDLIFEPGLHGDRIGGYGHELHLADNSVDGVTLHCSLEHFEDDTDTKFFQELERVLKPGGRAVILPFYLAHEYTIHVDPAYNLLKNHRPSIDPKARLRYCSWYQFFSRHYDPQALQERILSQAPSLQLTVHQVQNFREVDANSYLRLIGVFEKQA